MNNRKPGTFQKGNKAASGPHPGSGRTPDWLKAKCKAVVEKNKLIDFLRDVATGKDIDQTINDNGECLKVPAGIKERLRAVEMLLDRGWGKPQQMVDVGLDEGLRLDLSQIIAAARATEKANEQRP